MNIHKQSHTLTTKSVIVFEKPTSLTLHANSSIKNYPLRCSDFCSHKHRPDIEPPMLSDCSLSKTRCVGITPASSDGTSFTPPPESLADLIEPGALPAKTKART